MTTRPFQSLMPEQIVALPLHRELEARIIGPLRYGDGYYEFSFSTHIALTPELKQALTEEILVEHDRINTMKKD